MIDNHGDLKRGYDQEPSDQDDDEIVVLQLANGQNVSFTALAGIPFRGKYYVVLQPNEPIEGANLDEDEALVFLVTKDNRGNNNFELILDDDLLAQLHAEYERMVENA